jgi:hypothetical protein
VLNEEGDARAALPSAEEIVSPPRMCITMGGYMTPLLVVFLFFFSSGVVVACGVNDITTRNRSCHVRNIGTAAVTISSTPITLGSGDGVPAYTRLLGGRHKE